MKEKGMLKQLLGHWKSHKRKPSLLPEDVEFNPDDPSKINPVFEDSDGSLTSLQRVDSVPPESIPAYDNRSKIDLDLVDVSVAATSNTDYLNASEEDPDDVINQIDIVLDNSMNNDYDISSQLIENTTEQMPITSTSDKSDVKKESSEIMETKREPKSSLYRILEASSNHGIPKQSLPDIKSIKSVEKTTSLTKTKVSNHKLQQQQESKIETEGMTSNSKSKIQDPVEQIAVQGTSNETTHELINNKIKLQSPSPIVQTNLNMNVKARAIDELIKKFQGQNGSENGPAIHTVKSFLHSPNGKDFFKTKSEMKNDSAFPDKKREKESLSNIFNFPPPPPLELEKSNPQMDKSILIGVKSPISSELRNDDSASNQVGKTRSDSSLPRNKTVSSHDSDAQTQEKINPNENPTKNNSTNKDTTREVNTKSNQSEPPKNILKNILPPEPILKKKDELLKENMHSFSSKDNSEEKPLVPKQTKTEIKAVADSNIQESFNIPGVTRKSSLTTSTSSKQASFRKQSTSLMDMSQSPETKRTTIPSKTVSDEVSTPKETDAMKSQSEDSGITRGDQISSEVHPSIAQTELLQENNVTPPAKSKENPKERKPSPGHKKKCKFCKRSHGTSLRRGQCDDYYDALTGGIRPKHRTKHSDSWTSDLSWEEKEIIRRLRSRRDTLRSNATSTKSGHSRHRNSNGYFHRHHSVRRSVSQDSIYNASSVCSCDNCWMFLIKDSAYNRASLRESLPQVLCTCRSVRPDLIGRKVKFNSDTIIEDSPSENISSTPTIPEEPSKAEEANDGRSNLSSTSPDNPTRKLPQRKDKKALKDNYRLVTPWELEQWDLAMKRHLLQKRRKRARYMGFMALAMVVFVGLVVAVLMVYLRRKVL